VATNPPPTAPRPEPLRPRHEAAIVTAAVAVFVGVAWFKALRHPYPFFDDPDFLYLGNRIREDGGPLRLVSDLFAGRFTESNRHPLELALLALFARPEVGYHRDAQALAVALGAAAILSCWWATRRHCGRAPAALLAVLLAGSGALVLTASIECSDALLVIFYAQAVSAILDGGSAGRGAGADDPAARRAFLWAGVWSGLAYLAKGPGMFLPICLALTLLLRARLRPLREARTWLFAGAFALVASPLLWRNQRVYGSPFYHDNERFLWIDRLPDYAEVYAPHADARLPHGLCEYLARVTPGALGWRAAMGLGETTFHLGDAMALVAPRPMGALNIGWVVLGAIAAGAAVRVLWRGEPRFMRTFLLVHCAWWFLFLAFFNAAGGAARYFLPLTMTTLAPALAARLVRRSRWVCGACAAVVLAIGSTLALDASPTAPPAGYLEVQDWLVRRLDDGDVYAVDARTHLRPDWLTPRAHQLIVSASWKDAPVPAEELLGYLCEKRVRYVVLDAEARTTSVEAGATRERYLFYDLVPLGPDGSLPLRGFPGGWRPVYVGSESPRRWVVLETDCAAKRALGG
jgi:Dolichyl-phosphate-mannose-protein mannosyltransferase